MTNAVSLAQQASTGVSQGFKNRLINGNMVIDQRNAGASVTPANNDYTLDRYQIKTTQASKFTLQQNAGSITPPAGFTNYLGVTSSSAYSVVSGDHFGIIQSIEGYNVADLNFGSANAKTVTLSFWVRSSLTGTFGGTIYNSAANRSYPYSYTISSANTWEQKSVTITGDTTGTWLTTNGVGLVVWFGLGAGSTYSGTANTWANTWYAQPTGTVSVVGTNGASWYVTGCQLEIGSTATSFDYRPYGTELALCQRYYEKSYNVGTVPGTSTNTGMFYSTGIASITTTTNVKLGSGQFKVTKRTTPTMVYYDSAGNSNKCRVQVAGVSETDNQPVQDYATGENVMNLYSNGGAVAGNGIAWHFTASAEL